MQETWSVLQEFTRINRLRAPNFPSYMFGSEPTYHEGDDNEANFEEEGEA